MKIIETLAFTCVEEKDIQTAAQRWLTLSFDEKFSEEEGKILRRAAYEQSGWTHDSLVMAAMVVRKLMGVALQRKSNIRSAIGSQPTALILKPELMAETIEQSMSMALDDLRKLRDMLLFAASQTRPTPDVSDSDDVSDSEIQFRLFR